MGDKEDKIAKIDNSIKKLEAQKAKIDRAIKIKDQRNYRKERARRLIQTGALAEKYFDIENLGMDEREVLFKMFSQFIVKNKPDYLKK